MFITDAFLKNKLQNQIFYILFIDLLEKARVISQQPLERSYQIFYQIMSGKIKKLKGNISYMCLYLILLANTL